MSEPKPTTLPVIRIDVEWSSAWSEILTRSDWQARLALEISRVGTDVLATWGVPGQIAVTLAGRSALEEPFQVRVEGALCRGHADFFVELHSLFLRRLLSPESRVGEVNAWISGLVNAGADPESKDGRRLIEFVSMACRELLQCQPSRLLGEAPAEAYRQRLLASWPEALSGTTMRPLLSRALDLGLSLADISTVAAALRDGLRQNHDRHELAEDLIEALQLHEIQIRLAPAYLRALTEGTSMAEAKPLARMREDLFYELGLTLPDFRFETDPQLPPDCFAFQLNQRVTLPRQGLSPTERLALGTVEALRPLGLQPHAAAVDPDRRVSLQVLDSTDAASASRAGMTTWTPLDYLVHCLKSELRRRAAALLSRSAVQSGFERLGQTSPVLMAAVRERLPASRLSAVWRELLTEEVSVRDQARILEAALDCDYVLADESRQIVFDERLAFCIEPPDDWNHDPVLLAASVRRALKRYLSHKYTRGQSTMITYLLDPALERQLAAHADGTVPLNDPALEQIVEAVRSVIKPPQASSPPTVLTCTEARRPFRQLVGPLYPWLSVVSYQELSPELNIQPVARITVENQRDSSSSD